MTDRMVQVPVSLIDEAAAILDQRGATATAHALRRALLSQPTPIADPPRIKDPAPGATEEALDAAWNEYTADSRDKGLLFGMDKSPREAFIVGFHAGSHIDPATVHSVTPPKEDNTPIA